MTHFTSEWYQAQIAKRHQQVAASNQGVDHEAELHNAIVEECKRRGWIALHGRMDMASSRTIGEPDFTILADRSRVFFIECKTRTGKLSPAQLALHAWASKLGHEVSTVRSMEEFFKAITPQTVEHLRD